jgi:hypothetical protein
MDRLVLAVLCALVGLLMFIMAERELALTDRVDALHHQLDALKLSVQHSDEVGSPALRRHMDLPMSQAHLGQDRCACPPLFP